MAQTKMTEEYIVVEDNNGNRITAKVYRDNILAQIEYYEVVDNTGKNYLSFSYDECPLSNNPLVKVEYYDENGKMIEKTVFTVKIDKRFKNKTLYRHYKRHYKTK